MEQHEADLITAFFENEGGKAYLRAIENMCDTSRKSMEELEAVPMYRAQGEVRAYRSVLRLHEQLKGQFTDGN